VHQVGLLSTKNISLGLKETLVRLSEEDRQHEGGLEAIKGRPIIAVSGSLAYLYTNFCY
jgi:hypothetical protein